MVKRIYIWGVGKGYEIVRNALDLNCVEIIGFLDNDSLLWGKQKEGHTVYSPNDFSLQYDYILISVIKDIDIIKEQLVKIGVEKNRILAYFDSTDCMMNKVDFVNQTVRILQLWEMKIKGTYSKILNMEYEIADKIRKSQYQFPIIESAESALNRIIESSLSMCRFGDGEFGIIFYRTRLAYQRENSLLADRLKEILVNKEEKIVTCIANNYGDLGCYTEEAAAAIREYMQPSVRKNHMKLLDINKTYYDAYVSRPYIIYKNKEYAKRLFSLWKKVWCNRNVVIVEGRFTKTGYGNTLFENARTVERILCPAQNAWDCYDDIFDKIINSITKDKLILIALGPTATVLAYDLSRKGYQAIDIGQIDNEYEWYIRGVSERVLLDNKYVHEVGSRGRIKEDSYDAIFEEQVICKVGC